MSKIFVLVFFSIVLSFGSVFTNAQTTQLNDIFIGKWVSGDSIGFEINKNGFVELDKIYDKWEKTFYSSHRTNYEFLDTARICTTLIFESWAVFLFLEEGMNIVYDDGTFGYDFILMARFSICSMTMIDSNTMKLDISKVCEVSAFNETPSLEITAEMKTTLLSEKVNERNIILSRLK